MKNKSYTTNLPTTTDILWEEKRELFARLNGIWYKVIERTIETGCHGNNQVKPVVTKKFAFILEGNRLGSVSVTSGVTYDAKGNGTELYRQFQLIKK